MRTAAGGDDDTPPPTHTHTHTSRMEGEYGLEDEVDSILVTEMRRRCTKRGFVVGEIFMGDAVVPFKLPTDRQQAAASEQDNSSGNSHTFGDFTFSESSCNRSAASTRQPDRQHHQQQQHPQQLVSGDPTFFAADETG